MIKRQVDNKYFNQPINGIDPITKGHFTIDWAFISSGYQFEAGNTDTPDALFAIGQITIDGNDSNPFYDGLIKTPLLIQDHPLSIEFSDGMRFIKIVEIGKWDSFGWDELDRNEKGKKIVLSNTEFEFLDNLNYLENIQEYKDNNLL